MNKTKKIILLIIFYFFTNYTYLNANIIEEIRVKGNQRLSVETIIMFSGLKVGDEIEKDVLNKSMKNLFKTDYFRDIKIKTLYNLVEINIIENPIIQSIQIRGIKNKEITRNLSEVSKKSEKYPYLQNNIKQQRTLLLILLEQVILIC